MSAHPRETVNRYRKARKIAKVFLSFTDDPESVDIPEARVIALQITDYDAASDSTWALVKELVAEQQAENMAVMAGFEAGLL